MLEWASLSEAGHTSIAASVSNSRNPKSSPTSVGVSMGTKSISDKRIHPMAPQLKFIAILCSWRDKCPNQPSSCYMDQLGIEKVKYKSVQVQTYCADSGIKKKATTTTFTNFLVAEFDRDLMYSYLRCYTSVKYTLEVDNRIVTRVLKGIHNVRPSTAKIRSSIGRESGISIRWCYENWKFLWFVSEFI